MAQTKYVGQSDLLYVITLIHTELAKYVKAVSGKDLSSEDFTTALKTKLEGIDLTQYSTTAQMNTAIANAVKDITGIKFEKVESFDKLPTVGVNGVIYLVPKAKAETNDIYDEYYWSGTAYEFMGTTAVDLSGYLKTSDLVELTQAEVNAIWQGVFGA